MLDPGGGGTPKPSPVHQLVQQLNTPMPTHPAYDAIGRSHPLNFTEGLPTSQDKQAYNVQRALWSRLQAKNITPQPNMPFPTFYPAQQQPDAWAWVGEARTPHFSNPARDTQINPMGPNTQALADQTLLHEWAHTNQFPTYKWAHAPGDVEGLADAYAALAQHKLGEQVGSPAYPERFRAAIQQYAPSFILHGQFR